MTPSLRRLTHPEEVATDARPNPIALDQKELARAVGLIALLLPLILWLGAWWEPLCRQSSISHYYYMPFLGSVMVAAMGFISIFMWNYPGHTRADRWAARLGSLGAITLAIFPTAGDGCAEARYLSRPIATLLVEDGPVYQVSDVAFGMTFLGWLDTQTLHWGGAALLFAVLTWFCLWSFRRDNGEGVIRTGSGARKSDAKTMRNTIYLGCGVVMLCVMALLLIDWGTSDGSTALFPPVFLLETLALAAFGISWMVKGRILQVLRDDADDAGARPRT